MVPARVRTKIRMPQCKAFGCLNEQGKCHNKDGSHKSFFKFRNPTKSKESRKLCAKWLANLKNANLPLHVRDNTRSGAHKVCEDHFTPDCFQGQGAHVFANDVAASLGFKPTRRILRHGAFPTQVDASSANTAGVAVRKRHAGKSNDIVHYEVCNNNWKFCVYIK